MSIFKNRNIVFLIVVALASLPVVSFAQIDTTKTHIDTIKTPTDTTQKKTFDEYLLTRKGLFGKLVKVIRVDTTQNDDIPGLIRNDIRFQKYRGRIIRHILIRRLDFGVPITDTSKGVTTTLIKIANALHHKTLEGVVRRNLFFRENDTIQPFLLADNEKYLRDLSYLQDARISVVRLNDIPDSVDVIVRTKDILSLGAKIGSVDPNNTDVSLIEENLGGMGDKITVKNLFDNRRTKKYGYGLEYVRRNIAGSFIDGYIGYNNANTDINGKKEETNYYVKLLRPLANLYMRFTYAFEASWHETKNMYWSDSLYNSDIRYSYNNFDIWAGVNFNAAFLDKYVRGQRLRGLVGLRFLTQKFDALPLVYHNVYDSRYADVTGTLANISIFARDFYKIQYIYGFGINEDVPEGIDIGLTSGFTRKNKKNRPYLGVKFERYYFTAKNRYLDFTARAEGSLYNKHFEDITVFGNLDFFNHLKNIGRWKQRTFLSAGIAWQINTVLNDPLFLESKYGLPEFRKQYMRGYIRASVKGESVFYTPLSIAFFRFAPFVFYNTSLFTPKNSTFEHSKLYTSIGGGLRTRNESLIFGTLEIRGYYFPGRDPSNHIFKIDFNTNLKFKYNSALVGRPDFIQFN